MSEPVPMSVPVEQVTTMERVREWSTVAARACREKGGEDTVILSVGATTRSPTRS